jgi:3-hydroxymyristoyl/3-hydroxydecanoyl-(acyl carrier protein) dehydratase
MSGRSFQDILNEVQLSFNDLSFHDAGQSLFPPVLSHTISDSSLSLSLDIQPDLGWFRGHFPGKPVLPGVVQLNWAVVVAQAVFGIRELPGEVLRLKFKSIVVPPCTIVLTLTRPAQADVYFEYTGSERQFSQGQLRFPGSTE